MSLQSLEWREVDLVYHSQLYPTSLTSVISTSTARMLALTPTCPWSPYIELFILDPMWMLWKMSKGQHRASQSPNLEESPLSVTGLVQTIYTLWHFHSLTPIWSLFLPGSDGSTCPLSSHDCTKWNVLHRSDEKKLVSVKNSWASCLLLHHEVWRDTLSNLVYHFI